MKIPETLSQLAVQEPLWIMLGLFLLLWVSFRYISTLFKVLFICLLISAAIWWSLGAGTFSWKPFQSQLKNNIQQEGRNGAKEFKTKTQVLVDEIRA